jgi:alpha-tubulin suppressor-like RCC1 family protein
VAALSAGDFHTCALTSAGAVKCWGRNDDGQLGDGTTTDELAPERLKGGAVWSSVSTGGGRTCGIRTDATLWCWGAAPIGDGSDADNPVPQQVLVSGVTAWGEVSAGSHHTCALANDGTRWCWGDNSSWQLGIGNDARSLVPVRGDLTPKWLHISAGDRHTCGVAEDGRLWCWGDNTYGQLGRQGGDGPSAALLAVGDLSTWTSVSAGAYDTCATTKGGQVWCWGNDELGQVGDGQTTSVDHPVLPYRLY